MKKFCVRVLPVLALIATCCYSHDYSQNGIVVSHPWARPTPISSVPAAVYFTLENRGNKIDTLLSVSASEGFSKAVEIHENNYQDGMMSMRQLDKLVLLPGEKIEFLPGGKHIMLKGLSERLEIDKKFFLTLRFENAGKIKVEVFVEDPDAPAPGKK